MIPTKPYQAWEVQEKDFPVTRKLEDQLKFLVKYAILAPNSHNTQPWLFKISKNNIEILPNFDRTLKYSDRTNRELNISLGCALGNLIIAANHFGFRTTIDYTPEDTPEEVAVRVKCSKTKGKIDPVKDLFPYIKRRRTNRTRYTDKPVNEEVIKNTYKLLDEEGVELFYINSKSHILKVSELVREAHLFAYSDRYFKEELSEWVRPIHTTKRDGMPLFNLGIPAVVTSFAKEIIKNVPARLQADKDSSLINSSPLILVVLAKYDTKEYWLKVGKITEYILLEFTKHGISSAAMAGILEYPVTNNKFVKLFDLKAVPLFFARVGFPSQETHSSPRIDSVDVLLS